MKEVEKKKNGGATWGKGKVGEFLLMGGIWTMKERVSREEEVVWFQQHYNRPSKNPKHEVKSQRKKLYTYQFCSFSWNKCECARRSDVKGSTLQTEPDGPVCLNYVVTTKDLCHKAVMKCEARATSQGCRGTKYYKWCVSLPKCFNKF